jgi:hypothetical protein
MASIYSGFKTPEEFEASIKGFSPEAQNAYRSGFINQPKDDGEYFNALLKTLRDSDYMKEQLKAKSEFDREQMRAAAPYKLMFDLPGQITQAFTLPGQLAMEGANRVANTVMTGVQALPGPQVAARSAQYTPMSYFGRG